MARISVVNDYPAFLETMYAILDGMEGHAVAGFDTDNSTVDDVVRSAPEVLIIDLGVGQHDSATWDAASLRQVEGLETVPFIVCSADVPALHEREEEFARLGSISILEKPFELERLMAAVNQALLR